MDPAVGHPNVLSPPPGPMQPQPTRRSSRLSLKTRNLKSELAAAANAELEPGSSNSTANLPPPSTINARTRTKSLPAQHRSSTPFTKKLKSPAAVRASDSKTAIVGVLRHSTPPGMKLGSLGQHIPRKRENIDTFLKREVRESQAIPFLAFTECILKVSPSDALILTRMFSGPGLAEFPTVIEARNEWQAVLDSGAPEPSRYIPFAKLANKMIGVMRQKNLLTAEHVPLVFCKNASREISTKPSPLSQVPRSPPSRYPDVTGIPQSVTERLLETLDVSLPAPAAHCYSVGSGCTLEWNEVLSCWEFKVGGKCAFRLHETAKEPALFKPWVDDDFEDEDDVPMAQMGATGTSANRLDGKLQVASYALEAFSHRGLRRHVINALIEGEWVTLWFYDRGGIFVAEPILVSNLALLGIVLYGMAKLSAFDWGYYHDIDFPQTDLLSADIPSSLLGSKITIPINGVDMHFQLGTQIYGESVICGRGTTVAHIEIDPISSKFTNQSLVVKYGWPVVKRQSEVDIMDFMRDQLLGSEDEYLLNHLPRFYATRDYSKLSDGPRAEIYKKFGLSVATDEDCVLRVIIMDELRPITELNPSQFLGAFRDILHCYSRLNTLLGVLHRDITLMNTMYRKVMVDGVEHIYGVINDWDLAFCPHIFHNDGPSSKHRSGTIPYSSIARLNNPPPESTVGQDLESFFWCFLIAVTCKTEPDVYSGPRKIVRWFTEDPETLRALKRNYLSDTFLFANQSVAFKAKWGVFEKSINAWGTELTYRHLTEENAFKAEQIKQVANDTQPKKAKAATTKRKNTTAKGVCRAQLAARVATISGRPLVGPTVEYDLIESYFSEQTSSTYQPTTMLSPSLCY